MTEMVTGPPLLLPLPPGEQALSPATATILTARAAITRVRFIAVPLLLAPLATLPNRWDKAFVRMLGHSSDVRQAIFRAVCDSCRDAFADNAGVLPVTLLDRIIRRDGNEGRPGRTVETGG